MGADDSRFGTPEVSVGVMGRARHLARLLTEPWVRWMYFTAEPMSGQQMKTVRAVIDTVPGENLLEVAMEHARMVSRHSDAALRMAKRALNAIETMDLQGGYASSRV